MAQRCGLSHNTVSHIWRGFGLQPHRTEASKSSSASLFIEKVRDVVGLYLNCRTGRRSCAWTRSPRSKRWIAPVRYCPCAREKWSGAPTITCAKARYLSLPPWTPEPAR